MKHILINKTLFHSYVARFFDKTKFRIISRVFRQNRILRNLVLISSENGKLFSLEKYLRNEI